MGLGSSVNWAWVGFKVLGGFRVGFGSKVEFRV